MEDAGLAAPAGLSQASRSVSLTHWTSCWSESIATSSKGYRRTKIKIQPGWDIEPVRAIRERFGDVPLMVDANAAYSLADAGIFKELDRFDLMMLEQPLAGGCSRRFG